MDLLNVEFFFFFLTFFKRSAIISMIHFLFIVIIDLLNYGLDKYFPQISNDLHVYLNLLIK